MVSKVVRTVLPLLLGSLLYLSLNYKSVYAQYQAGPGFGRIAVSGQFTVTATNVNAILTLIAGSNIAITTDNVAKTVTITGAGSGTLVSINADSTAAQILAAGTAGSDFNLVDNGTGTHTFNLPTASAAVRGALSSADWSTFNNKLSGNQVITLSGDVSGSGATAIVTTLASIISAGGPTGSATVAPIITWDAKGRLTAVSSATITPNFANVLGGTAGSVIFSNGTNLAQDNANFFWDDTNNRLGIRRTIPDAVVEIWGASGTAGVLTVTADQGSLTAPVFIVAGDNPISTSERFIVLRNGNTGVGDDTPDFLLDVAGTLGVDGNSTFSGGTVTLSVDTNFVLSGGVNGVSFDTDVLSIDATNNRVGIGTIAPAEALQVGSTTSPQSIHLWTNNGASGLRVLDSDTNQELFILSSVSGDSLLTLTDASGVAKVRLRANGDSTFSGGNVGINSATVSARLHVTDATEQLRLGYNSTNYNSFTVSSIGSLTIAATGTNPNITLTPGGTGRVIASAPITMKNYTVATLPAGTQGNIAYVTDALAPGFLVAVVGGGAVVTPVFYNGANWVAF